MEHELTHKHYCKASNLTEWNCVVDLARALGFKIMGGNYQHHPCIQFALDRPMELIPLTMPGRILLSVPDFISGLYFMAEKRKASPPPEPQAGGIRGEEREMYVFTEGKWVSILHRITKLEERAMTNEGLNHLRAQVDALRGTVSNLETALNEHLVAYREHYHVMGGAPITAAGAGDQVTNDEQVRYVSRLRMCYEDSEVSIRKEASPKNIPFEVALVYLKAGRKVRRAGWEQISSISYGMNGRFYFNPVPSSDSSRIWFEASGEELGATDWQVVPEP